MIEKDLGFVLKRYNFRETSVIVNLYTLRFGKITGILKGFYTLKKEFASSLDNFTLNEFVFYPKRSEIWLISFADLICSYPFLREDMPRARIAGVFFRLVERIMPLWEKNPSIFYLLKDSMYYLTREDERKLLYVFLIKFLTSCGFKPQFSRCISCHSLLDGDIFFSVSQGGLLCQSCRGKGDKAKEISRAVSSYILYIQKNDFPQVLRLSPSAACEEEIFYLLREFCAFHLEIDVYPPPAAREKLRGQTSKFQSSRT